MNVKMPVPSWTSFRKASLSGWLRSQFISLPTHPNISCSSFRPLFIMAKSPPNIKSFFEPVPFPLQSPHKDDLANPQITTASIENGFVEPKSRRSTRELSPSHWRPQHDYEEVSISNLAPGPRRVSFTARVVNLYYEHKVDSKMPDSSKGCLKILVKDDSALILVCRSWVFCMNHSC